MAGPSTLFWDGSDVDATTIQQQISSLWAQLSEQQDLNLSTRARIFNLVVFAQDAAAMRRISDDLKDLSERHPSRVVIIQGDRVHPGAWLDASVRMQCVAGEESPLCFEEIQVAARGRAADHLSSVVIPLLMPELPVYLWWPGQPPFGHKTFNRLLSVVDHLVIDSAQFESPGDGFANLAQICAGTHGINDFHWTRLQTWGEIIAQFFDGADWRPYLRQVRSVRLEFAQGGDNFRRVTAGALLVTAWLSSALGWKPETTLEELATDDVQLTVVQDERVIPVAVEFRDHGEKATGHLMATELVAQGNDGPEARFVVERTPDLWHAQVTTRVQGFDEVQRTVPIDLKTDPQLLADVLEQTGHDYLYKRVVTEASELAGREKWVFS